MPFTDATLSASPVHLAVLIFADFADLPVRGALAPLPIVVPAGLAGADADVAGFTFSCLNERILQLGSVETDESGTGAVSVNLLADPNDEDLMNAVNDPALYDGRALKIWEVLHDGNGTALEIKEPFLLYMTQPQERLSRDSAVITMTCESYLVLANAAAHGRTYLDQAIFDAGDLSPSVTMGQGGQSGTLPEYVPDRGRDWVIP